MYMNGRSAGLEASRMPHTQHGKSRPSADQKVSEHVSDRIVALTIVAQWLGMEPP
jgi:hypothetical protein